MMKIIEGGFKKGLWQSDREAYSDEDIEAWNERLKQLSRHHPWLKEFVWQIKPRQKLRLVQSVGHPKESTFSKQSSR